jgi:hypothetical protein
MEYFEASYWMRTKTSEVIYLASSGGKLMHGTLKNLNPLLRCLGDEYDEILSFGNNSQFVPEDDAKIIPYVSKRDENTLKIDLLLANSEPVQSAEYLGKNPEEMKYKLSVEAHCWSMYRPANIVDFEPNLAFMLNEFAKLKEDFPANCLLRFKMFMDDLYHTPYVYGYFVPLENITICKEKLVVNEDKYLLEFCGIHQAYYFAIDKSKYDSACKVTEKDLEMLG